MKHLVEALRWCAIVALGVVAATVTYDVEVVSRSKTPTLSYVDKTSTYQQVFNPTWVQPSAGTGGKGGILVRTQNCDVNVGDACVFCGGSEAKASILTYSEEVSPNVFKALDENSVVFGPSDAYDSWGTEDPRMQYDPKTGIYYMFYTAYNGSAPMLNVATTTNPTSKNSDWVKHGQVFPSLQNTKSAALLLRDDGNHYLFWGDHDIRVTTSTDPTVWESTGSIILSPRTDHFDSQLVESGPPPMRLSTGDYLFFYNSAELGWPTNTSTAYHVGYVILSGEDPSVVLQRSETPLLGPKYAWEQGTSPYPCNVPNVVFLEAAHPLGDDSFRVFFGAADANIGSAVVKVKPSKFSSDAAKPQTVCVACSDSCVLVPTSKKYPCYEGTPKDASVCFETDPLLSEGTTARCGHCTDFGFSNYVRNDPIYTTMELWFGIGATEETAPVASTADAVCDGCGDTCSLIPGSKAAPCYEGTPENTADCFANDPLLTDGTAWVCGTCKDHGYPKYLRNDPIFTEMGLWK
jgi:predicted GH43/DUF377 family glycosyl hydrolase